MPKKNSTLTKNASTSEDGTDNVTITPVEELCINNNRIPIYTLSITRNASRLVNDPTPATRTFTTSAATKTNQTNGKRAYSFLNSTQAKKRHILKVSEAYTDLQIYGDLSTAELAHAAVIESIDEALKTGEFDSPNKPVVTIFK